MNFESMLDELRFGSAMCRPHWFPNSFIFLEDWQNNKVVSLVIADGKFPKRKEAYYFSYADVVATDWEKV